MRNDITGMEEFEREECWWECNSESRKTIRKSRNISIPTIAITLSGPRFDLRTTVVSSHWSSQLDCQEQ